MLQARGIQLNKGVENELKDVRPTCFWCLHYIPGLTARACTPYKLTIRCCVDVWGAFDATFGLRVMHTQRTPSTVFMLPLVLRNALSCNALSQRSSKLPSIQLVAAKCTWTTKGWCVPYFLAHTPACTSARARTCLHGCMVVAMLSERSAGSGAGNRVPRAASHIVALYLVLCLLTSP